MHTNNRLSNYVPTTDTFQHCFLLSITLLYQLMKFQQIKHEQLLHASHLQSGTLQIQKIKGIIDLIMIQLQDRKFE